MIGWLAWKLRTYRDRCMSRCRVCGSREDVISFDPRGWWAYPFRRTWCPAHCPDHDYIYSRYDGHYCAHCGQLPDEEWHCDRAAAIAELEIRGEA